MNEQTPQWNAIDRQWVCWTCGHPLLICTEEELRYGLPTEPWTDVDSFVTRLVNYLTGKEKSVYGTSCEKPK